MRRRPITISSASRWRKEFWSAPFSDTYSIQLSDVFGDLDLALATYRHAVSAVIPELTRVAWHLKKDELGKGQPAVSKRKFVYNISRASYRKEWHEKYRQPGIGTRILAFFIRILPKIGPLKALSFQPPTPQTAALFERSFDRTLDEYRQLLADESAHSLCWKTATSIPATPHAPANTASPTIRTPNWRANSRRRSHPQ